MSELANKRNAGGKARSLLLSTVCAATLLGVEIIGSNRALAEERPVLWLELGGQFEQMDSPQQIWVPAAMSGPNAGPLAGSFPDIQKLPKTGYDADAALSFQPEDSDWLFSVTARYGKALHGAAGHRYVPGTEFHGHHILNYKNAYSATEKSEETHTILDFQAGKDIGIGIAGAESVLGAGIRVAQLHSRAGLDVHSLFYLTKFGHGDNYVRTDADRDFHGIGPMLSWEASAPLVGRTETGEITLDWAANAAVLFGKQNVRATEKGAAHQQVYVSYYLHHYAQTANTVLQRRKNVMVPDLGGSLAASFRLSSAKVSIGYRADFFFGAIDGGIATSKRENRGFYGPFASISIGVGN